MQKKMIEQAEKFVKNIHADDASGHDYAHLHRVRRMALEIAADENADLFIIEMAALLHDTVDEKLVDTDTGWHRLNAFFQEIGISDPDREAIEHILKFMSYRGGKNDGKLQTIEGRIVQDADRLDALGAIGIARTFMFAGKFNETMHDPDIEPRTTSNTDTPSTAINHFYEKLFKLKDLMNTDKGREMAESRNQYMKQFIAQFQKEWQ